MLRNRVKATESFDEYCTRWNHTHSIHSGQPDGKVTRVEVIDEHGRVYTRWNVNVELSFQDDGRTLKVFVSPRLVQ
jgi:hypothetical protein